MTGGVRLITNCFFYDSADLAHANKTISVDGRDYTFTNNVVSHVYYNVNNTRVNLSFTDHFWVGHSSGDNSKRIIFQGKSSITIADSAFVSYSATNNGNPHYIFERSGGTANANVFRDIVVDGCERGQYGDFLLTAEANTILRVLTTFSGNITNNSQGIPTRSDIRQITAHRANGNIVTENQSAVVLAEGGYGAEKISVLKHALFTQNDAGMSQGGASHTEQTGFTLDYNVSHDMEFGVAAKNYWHPSGHLSYMRRATITRVTGTISSSSGLTSVTVSNATGVIVGDVFVRSGGNSAIITGVSGTTLTLGQRFGGSFGTNGVANLTAGTAYTITKAYWPTGGYGDISKGQHDFSANPYYSDASRNALKWDVLNGGPGTMDHIINEAGKLSGFDAAGNVATFDSRYALANYLAYMRNGYAPRNPALKRAGDPADGSPDIGAIPVLLTFGTAAASMVQ
jgi:hypothetical protein